MHNDESQGELVTRLRHELGIASAYALELRSMITEALRQGSMGNPDLAHRVTNLDSWLEHWKANGTLMRL